MKKLAEGLTLKIHKRSLTFPLLLFIITFPIYVHNLSPSVYGGDSGDYITAALSRGVPHPSGYPLYTALGIIFTALPIQATQVWKMGLISAAFSSVTVILMYLVVYELTKARSLAVITSLTLAFLYPFWLYAEIVEVFALHSFFILALIFFVIKYRNSSNKKFLYATASLAGLSLTNNLTIIFLFPGIILTLFLSNKKLFLDLKTIFVSTFYFLIGLIPYIYIPIAARGDPLINWGRAVNYQNFIALVLRKDYGWLPTKAYEKEAIIKAEDEKKIKHSKRPLPKGVKGKRIPQINPISKQDKQLLSKINRMTQKEKARYIMTGEL